MTELQQAARKFADVMASETSSKDEINSSLRRIYDLIPNAEDEDFGNAMKTMFSLVKLPNADKASMAASICGYLVEQGYSGSAIVSDFIEFYENLLDTAFPFFNSYLERIKDIDESDDEREEKLNEIYQEVWEEHIENHPEEMDAVVSLDKFFPCGISIFSADKNSFSTGKSRLQDKVACAADINQGCYWFNQLFTVLFDEPVAVIDIDTNRGFLGKIGGIADNFQLQLMLMSIPGFNDEVNISDEDLDIIHGFGPQSSATVINGKWNMYDYELTEKSGWKGLINNKKMAADQAREFSDAWIWGEGIPSDIPVKNGYRVIILGQPSYIRNINVQRTFKNLEASVEIDKKLTKEEIDALLS